MDKFEGKRLFWKMVNEICEASDTTLQDKEGFVIERGMALSNDMCILFGLDTGNITIYDKDMNTVFIFDENSNVPVVFKDLFEGMEEI